MHYNVCIIQPEQYDHSMAFWELGEAVRYAIQELGHSASTGVNSISHDTVNIVIGCHLLDVGHKSALPPSTIILNVEQVYADDTAWNAKIFEWTKHFETWDYSERNIVKLRDMGAGNVKLLQLGFQKELRRIEPRPVQDIDVLFYEPLNGPAGKHPRKYRGAGLDCQTSFRRLRPRARRLHQQVEAGLEHAPVQIANL